MAQVFADAFEGSAFTNWSSTGIDAGNTLAKAAAALKNGAQGLHVIAGPGAGDDDAHANKTITGAAELWSVFWMKIVVSPATSNHDLLFKFGVNAAGLQARFGVRTQATYTNRLP